MFSGFKVLTIREHKLQKHAWYETIERNLGRLY